MSPSAVSSSAAGSSAAGSSAAIRAALRGYDPSDEQWEAIRAHLEPAAIVAGAGSGKTAVMTARIVYLVEEGLVRPSSVLGLTFTNKAAGELEERLGAALGAMVPHPREHPNVYTYNAFAQEVVREHGPRIGIDSGAGVLSLAQKWQMLLGLVDRLPSFEALELRHPLSFIPQTLDLADQCANHLVSPEELAEECERMLPFLTDEYAITATRKRKDFAAIIRGYIDEKKARRRIDYGDQISLAVRILESFEDVAAELRERFPVVLLDEYQDTNPAQKVLLQRLCPPGWAVTAVGDARQAIYAWRGASMFNLLRFDEEFPRADGSPCRMLSLTENFRSGRRIVELANRIIAKVPPERRRGDELVPVPANGDGCVKAAVFLDQEAEAAFVAEEIDELHKGGTSWREIAVLVRTRRYMDRIVAALEERDIPFEIPEVGGLLKIPAVVDTVAWLRVLSDRGPETNRWLARVLMGPRFRVHYRDLAPIARWAAVRNTELKGSDDVDPGEVAFSLLEGLDHLDEIEGVSEEARERIKEFLELLASLRPVASRPLLDLAQTVAERTGLVDTLRASPMRSAPAMLTNLHSFFAACSEFSPLEGEPTLGAFLDFLDAAEEAEDPIPLAASAGSDSVKVMTVHGAKGLEFDTVFLPVVAASPEFNRYDGTRKGSVFPDIRTSDPMTSTKQLPVGVRKDAEHLPRFKGNKGAYRKELKARAEEDERRLFYVAVTRAKQRLYCTAAHWYAPDDRKGPSAFLEEVLETADVLRLDEPGEENPLVERMRKGLVWPPVGDLSAEWVDRVEQLVDGSLDVDSVLALGGAEARELYDAHVRLLDGLRSVPVLGAVDAVPFSLSATDAVRIAAGKERVSSVLWPLPERPSDARRLGIEVHAWIEEGGRGLLGLAEEEGLDEASLVPDEETVRALRASYAAMGYEGRSLALLDSGEPMAELPFTLKVGEVLVRGRIDAVYACPDGLLEVVDFKTGAGESDRGQLELYAEALAELGYVGAEVKLTYAYLAGGRNESWTYRPSGLDAFEERLSGALR